MRRLALLAVCVALVAPPAGARSTTHGPRAALEAASVLAGHRLSPTAVEPLTLPDGTPNARALSIVLAAVERAGELRRAALAGVSDDEVTFARSIADRVSAGRDVAVSEVVRARAIIDRIDMGAMLDAAATVMDAAARALPMIKGGSATATCTPGNVVCVGSDGDDVWTEDVQILIEPGGDDTYLNNAGGVLNRQAFDAGGGCAFGGGTTGRARPNLACTAAPSSVCTYDTANEAAGTEDLPVVSLPGHDAPGTGDGTDGSCGDDARRDALVEHAAAIDRDPDSRAISLLIDAGGSDTYTVPWSHDDPLFGLVDACYPGEEDVRNTNRDLFQGSGLTGVGLAWDAGDGDDVWRGRLNAQGTGHVGGVGILVATGSGNATFWADRLAQGNGIAGGVGILANTKAGRHTYLLDPPIVYRNEFAPNGRECAQEGRAGQGQGGFGGIGVLWTEAQDATYRSVIHRVNEAYPYAPVLADGVPVLLPGNDAQGSGESFPIVDTPGGLVAGLGLLYDDTDGDAGVCADAGMLSGSTASTGTDLSTMGEPADCGPFNVAAELAPADDLGTAIQRLTAGAVGVRVVV